MTYPSIPVEGYWNNPISSTAQFTRVEMIEGGVIQRSRSQVLNSVRQQWAFNGVVKDRDTVDTFLRGRNGLPFIFQGAVYTCVEWTWEWLVFVSDGEGGTKGAWRLSGTFMEDFNPEPTAG